MGARPAFAGCHVLLPWPDSVLCEELCCHRHHPRWERSCSGRVKTKIPPYVKCNNLELVRRQQISRGFCHCSKCPSSVCPSGERTERVRAQRDGARRSGAAPGSRTGAQLQVCDTAVDRTEMLGTVGRLRGLSSVFLSCIFSQPPTL